MRLFNRKRRTLATIPEGSFIKSRLSGPTGNCVEVARLGDGILVRDSKNPTGAVLTFTFSEWRAFIEDVNTFRLP